MRSAWFFNLRLPACFSDAGDHAIAGHLAEAEAGEFEFSQKSAGASSELAAIAQTNRRRIARHFIQRDFRILTLFLASIHIEDDFFETLTFFPFQINGFFTSFLFCN
jgi:hypothetical protein